MDKKSKNETSFRKDLSAFLEESLKRYFDELDGEPCNNLYDMASTTLERELFEFVLRHHNNNISMAAQTLGISRTTLSRKLSAYGLRRR